jgi:hypothetical protein
MSTIVIISAKIDMRLMFHYAKYPLVYLTVSDVVIMLHGFTILWVL